MVGGAGVRSCAEYLEAVANAEREESAYQKSERMFTWTQGMLKEMSLEHFLRGNRPTIDFPRKVSCGLGV